MAEDEIPTVRPVTSAVSSESSGSTEDSDGSQETVGALAEARVDYIGEDPHSSASRLNRFLRRLAEN